MQTETGTAVVLAEKPPRRASENLRSLPAVERVLHALGPVPLPRPSLLKLVREEIGNARQSGAFPGLAGIVTAVKEQILALQRRRLQTLINATGVLVHTNFGRAPLAPEAVAAISRVALGYNNLEFDLAAGKRGNRAAYLEHQLAVLCESKAATIVNNCAAALLLVVAHFTRRRREVIISRGELVQIGGGFRIPEILEAAGARIREIGTTNQTTPQDYAGAVSKDTGVILKVHRSNFVMSGFVASVSTADLASVARKHRVPFVEDLGAGAVWDTAAVPGLSHEITPRECLRAGATVVTFSGDKLLGGPQAGILAGDSRDIEAIKRHPLFRALRCDKLVLAGLEVTVDLHLAGQAAKRVPLLALAHAPVEELQRRAEALRQFLVDAPAAIRVSNAPSEMGGGGLPGCSIPSVALEVSVPGTAPLVLFHRLLGGDPPVAGTISRDRLLLNLRTVLPEQDLVLAAALSSALQPSP